MAALAAASVSCSRRDLIFANTELAGWVYVSGPVSGVVVHAYHLGDGCEKGDEVARSAPTGADGAFTLPLGPEEGRFWLEATGPGTYRELATGDEIALDAAVAVRTVALNVTANESRRDVMLTGLTSMAAGLGCARHALGKDGGLDGAMKRASSLIGGHFLGVEIDRTKPADLAAASSLTPEARYALVHAGLSQLARDMGTASRPALSKNDANSLLLSHRLADDLESQEAFFEGSGRQGKVSLGICDRPCTFSDQTVRADLFAAFTHYLNGDRKPSDSIKSAAAVWTTALRDDREAELFGGTGPSGGPDGGIVDSTAPTVDFVVPRDRDAVSGTTVLEVRARDDIQVSTLEVLVNGARAPMDTDPAVEHYAGALDTKAFPDGPLTIMASATNLAGKRTERSITVTVVNSGPGVIVGVCIKGPLRGATATAYTYANGAAGQALGTAGRTDDLGRFTISGIQGWSGAIVLVCGGTGATYAEEAFTSTTVMGQHEGLRTLLPSFSNTASVVVSPWTTLASAYTEALVKRGQPLAAAQPAAFAAVAALLGVSEIEHTPPAVLGPTVTTATDEGRTAMALAGLSQLAVTYATLGHVTPGTAVNALIMTQRLEADIADGCLDGRDGSGSAITVGGVPLTSFALRYQLAEAVATYIGGSYNVSGVRQPRDAIDLLDDLSLNGPLAAGSGCAPGQLFPEPGAAYDREPPRIEWDVMMPPDGSFVRAPFTLKATASDKISVHPQLVIKSPDWLVGGDGDSSADGVIAMVAETYQGDLTVVLGATDGAGNKSEARRTYHVDNSGTVPEIALDGVTRADGWTNQDVTVRATAQDPRATLVVTIDGAPAGAAQLVSAEGLHTVMVTATDQAGNMRSASRTFVIDKGAPSITGIALPPEGAVVRGQLLLTAVIDDAQRELADGSLPLVPETLSAQATGATGTQGAAGGGKVQVSVGLPAQDGLITITWTGQDRAGNHAAPLTWSGVVDTMPPRATLRLEPALNIDNPWTQTNETISVDVLDANADHVEMTVDGSPVTMPYQVVTEGKHTVSAAAIDKAGWRSEPVTSVFFIDRSLPLITASGTSGVVKSLAITAVVNDDLAADGSMLPPGTFEVSPAVATCPAWSKSPDGTTLSLTCTPGDGDYNFTFTGRDRSGNLAAPRMFSASVDNIDPMVSISTGVSQGAWTNQSVTVTTTVVEPHPKTVQTVLTTLPASTQNIPATYTVSTQGQFSVTATATDAAGNVGSAGPATFNIDKTAPTITWLSPAAGWVKGMFTLDATASDGFPGNVTPSLTYTNPPGGFVNGGGVGRVTGSITTAGNITITLKASDQAGNSTTESKTVQVDNTAPSLAVSGDGGWVGDGGSQATTKSYTLAGTATDAQSGMKKVVVRKGLTDVATITAFGAGGSWSAGVTLAQSGCAATSWTGANVLTVEATDNVDNVTTKQVTINFDPCPPKVAVVPTSVHDEREFTANAATPCVNLSGNTVKQLCDSSVAGCVVPDVYKYAINLTAAGASCGTPGTENPIRWRLAVTDVGKGTVGSVTYVVKASGVTKGSGTAAADGSGATHKIDVVSDTIAGLDTIEGTWNVEVTATDELGNASKISTLAWSHHLIGGPVELALQAEVESYFGVPATDVVNPKQASLTANNMAALTNPNIRNFIYLFRFTNHTSRDTFMQVTPTSQATFTRTINQKSVFIGSTGEGTGPSCPKGFSPPDVSGSCVDVPNNINGSAEAITKTGFITSTGGWIVNSGWNGYVGPAAAGPTANEWLIPAGTTVDVILLSSGNMFASGLFDGGTLTDYSFTGVGGTFNLFGDSGYEYGKNNSTSIDVYRFVRYLKTADVVTSGLNNNASLHSRFQKTSELLAPQPLIASPAFTFHYTSPTETPLP